MGWYILSKGISYTLAKEAVGWLSEEGYGDGAAHQEDKLLSPTRRIGAMETTPASKVYRRSRCQRRCAIGSTASIIGWLPRRSLLVWGGCEERDATVVSSLHSPSDVLSHAVAVGTLQGA